MSRIRDGERGAGRGFWRAGALACVAAAAALLAGGCETKVISLHSAKDFDREVLDTDGVVLVDFYKAGCALCMALDPTIEQLAKEYDGRARVARYMAMTFVFGVRSWHLVRTYDLAFFPTVVLFVDGQEKERWTVVYDADRYRKVLDQYVPAPTTQPEGAPGGPSEPGEPPPSGRTYRVIAQGAATQPDEQGDADLFAASAREHRPAVASRPPSDEPASPPSALMALAEDESAGGAGDTSGADEREATPTPPRPRQPHGLLTASSESEPPAPTTQPGAGRGGQTTSNH